MSEELIDKIRELITDCKYYKKQTESLLKTLKGAVEIPDISAYIGDRAIIKPYDLFSSYNIVAADAEYYALPKENWKNILTPIQKQVHKVLKSWRRAVADCDDWSLLMASFVASAFAETDIDKQGAFCIVWSYTHAYNGFVTKEGVMWIYEPQLGSTVGKLGETQKPYDSRAIWFMG